MTTPFTVILAFITIWLIAMLRCLGYSRLGKMVVAAQEEKSTEEDIPMSIVIIAHDQEEHLRVNLPHFLNQEYEGPFEVIVVDMASKDDTRLLLESMQGRYPNLHITQMPSTMRDISQLRLAITLGMRAASYDWVILSQADCMPSSLQWLSRMSAACQRREGLKMVLGYTRYIHANGWTGLRCRFYRLLQQMYCLPAVKHFGAYQADGTNICYRRDFFMEHRGFAEHANLIAGATEIMVNRQSTRKNSTVELHPESFMLQECPRESRLWHQKLLFDRETRRHYRHTFCYRAKFESAKWLNILYQASFITALAFCIHFQEWPLLVSVAILWLVHFIFRNWEWHRTASILGENNTYLSLATLLNLVPLWQFRTWCKWLFTNKKTFRKKFV